jgi:hypothetical protein
MLKNTFVSACFVLAMAANTADAGVIPVEDSGWWDSTGFSTNSSLSNYIAGTWLCLASDGCNISMGPDYPVTTRNFFVFDLGNLVGVGSGVGTVTSAKLRLSSGDIAWNDGTYELFDVDPTTIPDLRLAVGHELPPLKPDIYADLGTGVSYGSEGPIQNVNAAVSPYEPGQYIVEIDLNAAALEAINGFNDCVEPNPSSKQCYWAMGGRFDPFLYAFAYTGLGVREIVYETTPVPAPATLALFGLGLAGLGWSRRKKA